MKRLIVFLATISLTAPAVEAVIIDFENLPPFGEEFSSYREAGAKITAVDGGNMMAQPSHNGTMGVVAWPMPFSELRADFDVPAIFVRVDLGDAGSDSDLAFLEVFDEHNVSLAYTDFQIPAGSTQIVTLELCQDGIAYAVFGARNAVNGSSITADNLEFELIPEPATLLLLAIGALITPSRAKRRH